MDHHGRADVVVRIRRRRIAKADAVSHIHGDFLGALRDERGLRSAQVQDQGAFALKLHLHRVGVGVLRVGKDGFDDQLGVLGVLGVLGAIEPVLHGLADAALLILDSGIRAHNEAVL